MSPRRFMLSPVAGGFPRVSGDEPYLSESMGVSNEFSPRERG